MTQNANLSYVTEPCSNPGAAWVCHDPDVCVGWLEAPVWVSPGTPSSSLSPLMHGCPRLGLCFCSELWGQPDAKPLIYPELASRKMVGTFCFITGVRNGGSCGSPLTLQPSEEWHKEESSWKRAERPGAEADLWHSG